MTIESRNEVDAYHATIHMAGDINHARQVCRKFVMDGACVQLAPCEYVYTGGMEAGFTCRIMNYARFPADKTTIDDKAERLARMLCQELCQISFSIETPNSCRYYQDDVLKK